MTKHTSSSMEYEFKPERIAKLLGLSDYEPALDEADLDRNHKLLYGKFDPINYDEFGNHLSEKMLTGDNFASERINVLLQKIRSLKTESLVSALSKIRPNFADQESEWRYAFYFLNIRLSEIGIAPRWRGMQRPLFKKKSEWTEGDIRYARDMQVFDMQWLYSEYPNHRVVSSYNGLVKKLMDTKPFDFAHAFMLSAAEVTSAKKSRMFKLTRDMQAEMSMLRFKDIDKEHKRLLQRLEEVESDLVLAANRNPRRGKKLIDVISDRLNLWLAVMITKGSSEKVMIENYRKITGRVIKRSTFRSNLKSLNAALQEVDSKYAF